MLFSIFSLLLPENSYIILYMKKIAALTLFVCIILSVNSHAEVSYDSYSDIDHAWDNQKPITNQEFEKAIETLTAKQKKKDEKAKKKKIKKISGGGTSLHKGLEPMGELQEQEILKEKDENEGQLINIPVDVVIDGKVLEKGFYNVYGERDKNNNDIYLSFYQAHYLMGKVKAYPTKNDFEAENLDFVKMIPYDEKYIQIIFGSLDFNAYTYLQYLPEKQ